MQRIFAHEIIYKGISYRNCVAELASDTTQPTFYPFIEEIHSTRFLSGTVEVTVDNGNLIARTASSGPSIPLNKL